MLLKIQQSIIKNAIEEDIKQNYNVKNIYIDLSLMEGYSEEIYRIYISFINDNLTSKGLMFYYYETDLKDNIDYIRKNILSSINKLIN